MQIYHDNGTQSITHNGELYEADENGRIEVSLEVAKEITRFPGFHIYTGDPEPSAEELAQIEKQELLDRISALEAALKKSNSARIPARRAVTKS